MKPRRVHRVPCWVESADVETLVFASALDARGMTVSTSRDHFGRVAVAGQAVRFRLQLPGAAAPVSGAARVAELHGPTENGRASARLEFIDGKGLEQLEVFARTHRPRVLVVDDDPDHHADYEGLAPDFEPVIVATGAEALKRYGESPVPVLIVSEQLVDVHCLPLLQQLSERYPGAPAARLVVSDFTVAGQVKQLINDGQIFAYLRKPFDASYLRQAVERALDAFHLVAENALLGEELQRANQRLASENEFLRRRLVGVAGFESIVGTSGELKRVLDEVRRVQRTEATVHLVGETGSGKELVARALHQGGPRAGRPFVVQNLAGLADSLLQSALFGYRRGAFTGADRDFPGAFPQADGGTLFFDEVGEVPPAAQASLLRALQEGEFTPLGAGAPERADVRIVSGSQLDLRAEVAAGRFREDLFFRLAVIVIRLPPLRERKGDIPLLAAHFLDLQCERTGKNLAGFSREAMAALERYSWPGNVRELDNEIERLVVLAADHRAISLDMLSPRLRESGPAPVAPPPTDAYAVPRRGSLDEAVTALERQMIERAFKEAGGNVTQAAKLLGMERSRMSKLRDRLGLGPGVTP